MERLLYSEHINFIKSNLDADLSVLSLKRNSYNPPEFKEMLNEIKCRRKLQDKFPSWANNYSLKMPKPVNIEQSSCKETALFKSQIFNYNSSLDLSAGFGIDSYFFALQSENHIAIEPDEELYNLSKDNFSTLRMNNSTFINQSASSFLKKNRLNFDLVYIDPSRRDSHGNRKVNLSDYEPNLIELYPQIKQIARYLIVKLSPMLDFTYLEKQFPEVNKFYVVSVNGECKEILMVFDFISQYNTLQYHTIELGNSKFNYIFEEDPKLEINYSMPQKYIYDLHPVIKKSGFYDSYAMSLGLTKLNKNSHIFTSDDIKRNFKGKIYRLLDTCKPDSKELQKIIPDLRAVVARYGFPLTVEAIRKKYSILEGKDKIVFAVKLLNNKNSFVVAEKIDI